mgnify:FL=1
MMEINVKTFSKAKALEAAFATVGADEFAFLSEILPSVDNQCTTNDEADDILEDLRAAYESGIEFTFESVQDFTRMIRKLYKCEYTCQYATLMTFDHNLSPRDVEQIMCGEFVNLKNSEHGGVEFEDCSRIEETNRIFYFLQHGAYEIVQEVLCQYVIELQKQTSKL